MRSPLLHTRAAAAALALMVLGCAKHPSQIAAPREEAVARAPLFDHAVGARYVDGAYIVVLKDNVGDVDQAIADLGRRHPFRTSFRYRHALRGFAAPLTPAAVEVLRGDPRVAYIERDQVAHAAGTQASPPSWGLDRIDQRQRPLDQSFAYNQTGAGVDVYVIDTGIRASHVDFGGRVVAGVDEVTPGGTADDANGHGTGVAGTIGGTLYGVAKGVRLIAVRVLNSDGDGYYSQVLAGVDWVTADHTTRPAVANMSLVGARSQSLDDGVKRSIADGVTYCVAAGNSSADASGFSPSDVAEAITVGATDGLDGFASFSNFGSLLDILAPGANITTDWSTSNTATLAVSGTSIATPHVSGAAALYLEANPTASPADVALALTANATGGVIGGLPAGTPNLLLYSIFGSAPAPLPPSAPVLSSPADGAVDVSTSPTLLWCPSAGALSYRVQVSTSSGFATTVLDRSGLGSTSTDATGLAGGTLYYWRAAASGSGGTSAWSPSWRFTTVAAPTSPPPAPTLYFPRNGATGVSTSPTLQWNAAAGATSYRLQVSTAWDFRTTVVDRSGIASASAPVSGLAAGSVYYWRVSAANSAGSSAWSAAWSFTTAGTPPGGPPGVPALLLPPNGATSVPITPTLKWATSTGATSYRLQIATSSSFGKLVYDQSGIPTNSMTVHGLSAATLYYWRVSAANSVGASAWSSSWSFRTKFEALTP